MATRFYLPAEGSGTPAVSPAFDATTFNLTSSAVRLQLIEKTGVSALTTLAASATKTIPVTTSQNIMGWQYVSGPIPAQRIIGTASFVCGFTESSLNANANLCVVLRVVSQDGGTARGTLLASTNQGTEFATTISTRIINAAALTALTTQPGDRLVFELGVTAAAPALTPTTFTGTLGDNNASDYALTAALTTTLNPWLELSQNIWDTAINQTQLWAVRPPNGISGNR